MLPSILSLLASQVNAQVPQECSVVGQIYTSLGGQYPGGIPTDCCKYVTCQSGKVVSIDWSNQNLQGVVSPLFAELTNLRTLNLSNNRLAGDIPGILYTRLMYLDVSNNGLGQLSKDVANLVLTVIEELKKNNSNVFTREQACKIKESLYGVRVNTDVTNILSGKITKEDVFVFASLFQADLPIQDIETVLASV
jgi:Leucine-rich repeat (LRR) protein